jgi:hypothetical protein
MWNGTRSTRRQFGVTYGPERSATTHPDMLDRGTGLDDAAKEKDRMFARHLRRCRVTQPRSPIHFSTVSAISISCWASAMDG